MELGSKSVKRLFCNFKASFSRFFAAERSFERALRGRKNRERLRDEQRPRRDHAGVVSSLSSVSCQSNRRGFVLLFSLTAHLHPDGAARIFSYHL